MRLLDHLVRDLSLHSPSQLELLKKFHHLRCNGGNAACHIDIARRNAAYSGYDADATVIASVKNAHMWGNKRRAGGDVINVDSASDSDTSREEKRARLNPEEQAQLLRLEDLPDEILLKIAYDLPRHVVARFCQASQRLAFICRDLSFWIERAKRNGLITEQHAIETIEDYKRMMREYRKMFMYDFDGEKMNWNNIISQGRIVSSLPIASMHGYLEIVRMLLTLGVDVNAEDGSAYALSLASTYGHIDIVKLLLAAGANVRAPNNDALILASSEGYVNIVELLLDAGADVDDYALQLASEYGRANVVQLLLDRGANVHAADDAALRMAISGGFDDDEAVREDERIVVVRLLLDAGAYVQAENNEALRTASEKGRIEIVRMLLAAGADVHDRGDAGDFAIYSAARRGYAEIVELLLDGYEYNGDILYDCLIEASSEGHDNVVRMLLTYGTYTYADIVGALQFARSNQRTEGVVRLLEDELATRRINEQNALQPLPPTSDGDDDSDLEITKELSLEEKLREKYQDAQREGRVVSLDDDDDYYPLPPRPQQPLPRPQQPQQSNTEVISLDSSPSPPRHPTQPPPQQRGVIYVDSADDSLYSSGSYDDSADDSLYSSDSYDD